MLVRTSTWDRVRSQFTDAEKAALNAAFTGQVICPRGVTVDENQLSPELRDKLTKAIKESK